MSYVKLTAEQANDLLVMLGEDPASGDEEFCLITTGTDSGHHIVSIAVLAQLTELGPQYFWTGTEWAPL